MSRKKAPIKGFLTLQKEMARKRITFIEIAHELNISESAVRAKIRMASPLKLNEAIIIQHVFFPRYNLEFLFSEAFSPEDTLRERIQRDATYFKPKKLHIL